MIKVSLKKHLRTAEGVMNLNVDLAIDSGEFVTLFGESGSGKTTILRMIAGLTRPDEGIVKVGDTVWFDSRRNINLPIQARRIGFVFQDYALFPHMTVRENLEFALENKEEHQFLHEIFEMIGLGELAGQRPAQLSGGQKQRVALARALVRKPSLLLLDEPLSALDLEWRIKLQDEILKLYNKYNLTTILVSHDYSEVFKLSRRVLLLKNGEIQRVGLPQDVFLTDNLSSKFRFTGDIIEITRDGVIHVMIVQVGHDLVRVVATEEEVRSLKVGDKIMVASKAFNPLILKIE